MEGGGGDNNKIVGVGRGGGALGEIGALVSRCGATELIGALVIGGAANAEICALATRRGAKAE